MYTRRAALVTLTSLRRAIKFFVWSLGGVEQNQNLSRVYGKIGADRFNLSNTVGNGNGSVQNQSDCRRLSESQSGVVTDFRVLTDLSMKVESRSTSKLDDIDQFTREGKLKEAVELLELIEKQAFAEAKSVHKHLAKSIAHLENGHGEESLELFAEFKQSGMRPDGQMFLGVFSMCGVISDVVERMLYFESMMNDYSVVPAMEHYASMMPVEPSVEIWETLMKFCRIHGNVMLGDQCTELVQILDPSLYGLLRALKQQMKEAGYIPEIKRGLHDVDHETKEEALMAHSERLAAAHGFLTSQAHASHGFVYAAIATMCLRSSQR
ncbi:hypothetical protein SASPL_106851 [Salvia splendens]|uniref:DYW domain-containing protein n=1 Tax=Salvia splendens TaxID=180675 RepID=A0A8X8YCE3_SALSN|nr:hypothetical protein SASPL_106851 [Salvia splendens]